MNIWSGVTHSRRHRRGASVFEGRNLYTKYGGDKCILQKKSGADFTEPKTAGIFVSMATWASFHRKDDVTPSDQYGV